jgi:trehalose synthase-fused probable maltokinase
VTVALRIDEQALIRHVSEQRWFGSKSRDIVGARVLDGVEVDRLTLLLVEVRFPEGTHDLYQVLAGSQDGRKGWFDAFGDADLIRELVRRVRGGATVDGDEGTVEFRPAGTKAFSEELARVDVITSEQSNSSVVLDDELILKAFRRLEAGVNPELELLRFLTEHGFANIATLAGWYAYSGRPLDATLGILQEYVAGATNGWDLALAELETAPEMFVTRLRRLGEVTGEMHTVLASDSTDPAFAPEETSAEALGLLTATVDEEIARAFVDLGDDERVAPIAGRAEDIREQLRLLSRFGSVGRVIRHHGDFHLGQTLWADGDWILIDFEGEPARSLPERRRKRSPLRDVAGMLRSFAYVASAVEILHGGEAPPGWEERARGEFLAGYQETVDPTLLPPGRESVERLIAIFELEKAVYELRYELNNRPEWAGIPVAGILRLLETGAPA